MEAHVVSNVEMMGVALLLRTKVMITQSNPELYCTVEGNKNAAKSTIHDFHRPTTLNIFIRNLQQMCDGIREKESGRASS